MTTATATSSKYPEWIYKSFFSPAAGRCEILMMHESGLYAVSAWEQDGKWVGELMTKQICRKTGKKGWESAKNQPDVATVPEIIAEAERRAKIIMNRN